MGSTQYLSSVYVLRLVLVVEAPTPDSEVGLQESSGPLPTGIRDVKCGIFLQKEANLNPRGCGAMNRPLWLCRVSQGAVNRFRNPGARAARRRWAPPSRNCSSEKPKEKPEDSELRDSHLGAAMRSASMLRSAAGQYGHEVTQMYQNLEKASWEKLWSTLSSGQ